MNHQHPNINFTFEVEKKNNFSFLDIKICKENNKCTTFVFRKPTFSGVFTNFDKFYTDIIQTWFSQYIIVGAKYYLT